MLLTFEPCLAGEYSDCILENMRNVGTDAAANAIRHACRKKALPYIPAKCNDIAPPTEINEFSIFDDTPAGCINSCLDASFWSKHFGECKE